MVEKVLVTAARYLDDRSQHKLVLDTDSGDYVVDVWHNDERQCHLDESRVRALVGERIDLAGLKDKVHERDVRHIQSWV